MTRSTGPLVGRPAPRLRWPGSLEAIVTVIPIAIAVCGGGAGLYLIVAVGAESLGAGARVTISVLASGVVYSAAFWVTALLRSRAARAEILSALLSLQLAAGRLAGLRDSSGPDVPADRLGETDELDLLQRLADAKLVAAAEIRILLFWSKQLLDGARVPAVVLQRVATRARDLTSRVDWLVNPPSPPASPATEDAAD